MEDFFDIETPTVSSHDHLLPRYSEHYLPVDQRPCGSNIAGSLQLFKASGINFLSRNLQVSDQSKPFLLMSRVIHILRYAKS